MIKRLGISILFILGVVFTPFAQTPFKFGYITVNQGLAHSDAVDVLQDSNGFIWIATNNGLDRYDGYGIKNYQLPNANVNGLYNNRISDIHISENGTLWAAPEEQGVFFLDPSTGSFKSITERTTKPQWQKTLGNISPRSITSIANDILVIGTRVQGIFIVQFDKNNQIKDIQQVQTTNTTSQPPVHKVERAIKKGIWVGTQGQGLWLLERKNEKYIPRQITEWKEPSVNALFLKPDSTLWISSANQVGLLDQKNGTHITHLQGSFASINCLFEDSSKRLWVGTNFGLHMIQNLQTEANGTVSFQSRIFAAEGEQGNSLNSNRVHQLFEDQFHNLWIAASAGGLNKLNLLAKPFLHLKRNPNVSPTLADNYINTILKDSENEHLWIGTRNGISRYDLQTKTYRNLLNNTSPGGLSNVSVSNFYDNKKGSLWVITRWDGIYILDKSSMNLRKLPDVPGQRPFNQIEPLSVVEDKEGNIWIATFYAGIFVFDKTGNPITTFSTGNSPLPTDNLTFLMPDGENMWVSSRNAGVFKLKYNSKKIEVAKHFNFAPNDKDGLKFNYTWPLLKDRKGNIWVGTIGGGLHLIQTINGKESIIRYDKWLPENNVESILEGENGEIWIGGRGLYRFNPEKKTYLHYDVADGLQSNSFKVGAATKDPKGTLFFGGINGITYFKPNEIKSNPYPPKMQITQLRIVSYDSSPEDTEHPRAIINGPFGKESTITIKDSENDFSIDFVGLNYHNPQKQHYAYKLEGYHQSWVPLPEGQRMVAFASLPAGDYTFMVKADNGDGVWAEQPAVLHLKILPPWYKAWWAYLLYTALLAAALVWYKNISRRQRALKEKMVREQMEHDKQTEIAEMKLDFFTQVSHELRTPLTLIVNPAEEVLKAIDPDSPTKQKAELVHKQANKLLSLVNQLMDFRKIEAGNLDLQLQSADIIDFITEIFLIFKIKAGEQNIQYNLDSPLKSLYMNFDPGKLEIILTNLLSNAFKHTPDNGIISLKIWQEDLLFIQVKDSGEGISQNEIKHIFEPFYQAIKKATPKNKGTGIGLSLVRDFTKMHGGMVTVNSILGMGSEFTVSFPISSDLVEKPKEEVFPQTYTPNVVVEQLRPQFTGEKILIVEDNDDLRKYLTDLFSPYLQTLNATNGKEALNQLGQNPPDLILSDVMMPEMDGLELCNKVKEAPKTSHIPVVLITARAAALHELEGLESGADDYIVKPFNPKLLVSKILAILANRRKVREYYHKQVLLEPKVAVVPDSDRIFIENAMAIIEQNLTNDQFSVQFLVQESNMSQSAFYRKLKNITGQSVVEFIRDVRIKRAAQLLSNGKFRVTEVMSMVGMEDYKYFLSAFQKVYNIPPSEYAKSMGKGLN